MLTKVNERFQMKDICGYQQSYTYSQFPDQRGGQVSAQDAFLKASNSGHESPLGKLKTSEN
jgi:hypothetical protein